jgi:ribose transport system substrate-binding protein
MIDRYVRATRRVVPAAICLCIAVSTWLPQSTGVTVVAAAGSEPPTGSSSPETSGDAGQTAMWRDDIPCPEPGTSVAYSPLTAEFVWFGDIVEAMEAEAAKCDVTVISDDPQNDAQAQVAGLENMLETGVAALAVITVDEEAVAPVVEQAREDGVVVIRHVGPVEGYDGAVGVPETVFGELIGEVGGEWLVEAKPDEAPYQIAILNADSLNVGLLDRKAGLISGFESVIGDAEYEIVADIEAFTEQTALDAANGILAANPELDLILSVNDEGALGALAAIESAGLTPNVDIAVTGSLLERGLQAVVEGRMPGGITVPGKDHGVGIIEAMFRALAGEPEGFIIDIPPVKLGNDPEEAQRRLDEGEY